MLISVYYKSVTLQGAFGSTHDNTNTNCNVCRKSLQIGQNKYQNKTAKNRNFQISKISIKF